MPNVNGFYFENTDRHLNKRDYSLSGRKMHLMYDSAEDELLDFVSGEELIRYRPHQAGIWLHYGCLTLRDSIRLIAYADPTEIAEGCVTLIVDEETGLVTRVTASFGTVPGRPDLAKCDYFFGVLKRDGQPLPQIRHCPTTELTGKKIAWTYPNGFVNVHIYRDHYCRAQALQRPEGNHDPLVDDPIYEEPCRFFKIRDNVYLMSNIEDHINRRNPGTGGNNLLLLMDLESMTDIGRNFRRAAGGKREWGFLHACGSLYEGTLETEVAPSPNTV